MKMDTLITGRPYEVAITYEGLREEEYSGLRVLDVGSGFCGLVPGLIKKGVDIYALDPAHPISSIPQNEEDLLIDMLQAEGFLQYTCAIREHPDRFVSADALEMEYRDEFDLILNRNLFPHFILNATSLMPAKKLLTKEFQAAKQGGRVRFSQWRLNDAPGSSIFSDISAVLIDWLWTEEMISESRSFQRGESLLSPEMLAYEAHPECMEFIAK